MASLKDEAHKASAQARQAFTEFRRDVRSLTGDARLAELNPRLAPPVLPPWDEIWRSRRAVWWTAGSAVLGTPLAAFVLSVFSPALGAAAGLLGFGVCAVSVLRLGWFICPRCGRRFDTVRKSRFQRWSNAFTRRCLFCGLEAGTSSGAWTGD